MIEKQKISKLLKATEHGIWTMLGDTSSALFLGSEGIYN